MTNKGDPTGLPRRLLMVALPVLLLAGAAEAAPPVEAAAPSSCLDQIAKAESFYKLPAGLLVSIALVESGRRDPATGLLAPWPWTLNAQGSGRFYDGPEEAMRDAANLLAKDYAFVDVGCMQVDLYHHPHAFRTLRAAFDPETNVDYAARYLRELYRSQGSWTAAIAAYNAGDPANGTDYLAKVLYYWKEKGTRAATAQAAPENPRQRGFVTEDAPDPFDLASAFFAKKDYDSALAIYRKRLTNHPDDLTALLGAAECLRQTGHLEEARSELERALTIDPSNRLALDALMRVIDQVPADRRLGHLLTARQVAPRAPEIHARIAMAEAGQGHFAEAVTEMATAVSLAPSDAVLLLDYALLLDQSGKAASALQAYDAFLKSYRPGTATLTIPLQQVKDRYAYLQSIRQ